ncbi:MAG TPA: DoxX family protein, partial [Pirellulales bacterium]
MLDRVLPKFVGPSGSVGLLAIRAVAGSAMVLHGLPKIQHALNWMGPDAKVPGALQAAAAVAEFGGGVCWVLGALTPIASILIGRNFGHWNASPVAEPTPTKTPKPFLALNCPLPSKAKLRASPVSCS